MNATETDIKKMLSDYKKITVIGISSDPSKAGLQIPLYMKSQGYDIVGVNPKLQSIQGIQVYPSLKDVPIEYRKFVDVFRRPENIPDVVEEILSVEGVKVLWLQLGITHPAAEKKAEDHGIQVVSDRCLLIEHKKL